MFIGPDVQYDWIGCILTPLLAHRSCRRPCMPFRTRAIFQYGAYFTTGEIDALFPHRRAGLSRKIGLRPEGMANSGRKGLFRAGRYFTHARLSYSPCALAAVTLWLFISPLSGLVLCAPRRPIIRPTGPVSHKERPGFSFPQTWSCWLKTNPPQRATETGPPKMTHTATNLNRDRAY